MSGPAGRGGPGGPGDEGGDPPSLVAVGNRVRPQPRAALLAVKELLDVAPLQLLEGPDLTVAQDQRARRRVIPIGLQLATNAFDRVARAAVVLPHQLRLAV